MKLRTLAACAMLALALTSCDDSSSSSDGNSNGGLPGAAVTSTSIVGLWHNSTSETEEGHVVTFDQYVQSTESHAMTLKVYMVMDGNMTSSSGSGTWTLKDGMLLTSLTIEGETSADTAFATIKDGSLHVKSTDPEANGETYVYTPATAIVPPKL